MMKRKPTGRSPLRLGPVLIHHRKDQNIYCGFLQNLIDLKQALQGTLSTGTDGEQALVNAIDAKLPNAHSRSLRCFRHLQDNFEWGKVKRPTSHVTRQANVKRQKL